MDFNNFKKGRDKLKESVAKMKDQAPKFKKDSRMWLPTKDDTGSSNALIRFLPQPDPEMPPTISFFQHGFKEKGKWFIDNCPSTFDNPCPVCEHIQPYWDEDTEESANYARRYSRTKQFIANILVIKDLIKPENDGKVFLFKFGVKIYEKIEEKIFPESELDESIQIFDPWVGCNFKLKLRQKSKRNNYDNSVFVDNKGPVAKDDDGLEIIYNQMIDLGEFLLPDKFPEYNKMAKKFNRIMKFKDGQKVATKTPADTKGDDLLDEFSDGPGPDKAKSETPVKEETKAENKKAPAADDGDFDFEDDNASAAGTPETETSSDKNDDFNFDDKDEDYNFDD
jgi:hypothetical protein